MTEGGPSEAPRTAPARGRVASIIAWLGRRGDTRLGRLSLRWVRAYFAMSLVCAAFSPVWANWCESERQLRSESP